MLRYRRPIPASNAERKLFHEGERNNRYRDRKLLFSLLGGRKYLILILPWTSYLDFCYWYKEQAFTRSKTVLLLCIAGAIACFVTNGGPFYDWVGAGLTSVQITGFNNGPKDLSIVDWTYKVQDGVHFLKDKQEITETRLCLPSFRIQDGVHFLPSSPAPEFTNPGAFGEARIRTKAGKTTHP